MSERFSWPNWWRFYRALVTRREPGALREAVLRAGIALLAEVGWRLDDPAPLPDRVLLVVGHQRSGTTWLHRLLTAQPGACALPLHGLLFPADAWQSLFRRVGWRPVLTRIEERLFAPLDPLHRIRFREPEGDLVDRRTHRDQPGAQQHPQIRPLGPRGQSLVLHQRQPVHEDLQVRFASLHAVQPLHVSHSNDIIGSHLRRLNGKWDTWPRPRDRVS